MDIDQLKNQLSENPHEVSFNDVIDVIDECYDYTPTRFRNGEIVNEAGENAGSCKIFSFAHMHGLTPQQTLHCFGDYYRIDVLGKPDGENHLNIRNFMAHGWVGVHFDGEALQTRID